MKPPVPHATIALSSPFGNNANKPIGKSGAVIMLAGFIASVIKITIPQAPNQRSLFTMWKLARLLNLQLQISFHIPDSKASHLDSRVRNVGRFS